MSSLPHHADSRICCHQVIVVSAMGSHPGSKLKVTDLLLNMVAKAVRQDDAFLLDLAALQVEAPPAGMYDCWALCVQPPEIIGDNACLAGDHLFGVALAAAIPAAGVWRFPLYRLIQRVFVHAACSCACQLQRVFFPARALRSMLVRARVHGGAGEARGDGEGGAGQR